MNIRRTTALAATAVAFASVTAGFAPTADALTPAASARPGDGWSVVALAPAKWAPRQSERIALVSPTGKQYTILSRLDANWSVLDASNDGRRVLLANYSRGSSYQLLDVRTGRLTPVAGHWSQMWFTNPSGQALLATQLVKGGTQLVRTDLTGTVTARFAGTTNTLTQISTMDGRHVVSTTSAGIQVNHNATGAVVRRIAAPAGTRYGCYLGHWSDATHFTAACFATGSRSTVYRFSLTGGKPVAITAGLPSSGRLQFGYADAWSTPKGQAVRVGSGCGAHPLGVVRGRSVSVVQPTSQLMTVHGTSAWLHDQSACQAFLPVSLSRYDIATGKRQVLAGGTANRGLVPTSAVVIDAHN